MSQNVWATIMQFGPVTLIFYWPKKKISGQPKAGPHFRHCLYYQIILCLYLLFQSLTHSINILNMYKIHGIHNISKVKEQCIFCCSNKSKIFLNFRYIPRFWLDFFFMFINIKIISS